MATARDRYYRKAYSEPLDKGRNAAAEADIAEAFEAPVDADGFQCGMCLLNRRQCVACARREAELMDAQRDVGFLEPDWVTLDADEIAAMEAAERDHEFEGWRRRPGRSQAAS